MYSRKKYYFFLCLLIHCCTFQAVLFEHNLPDDLQLKLYKFFNNNELRPGDCLQEHLALHTPLLEPTLTIESGGAKKQGSESLHNFLSTNQEMFVGVGIIDSVTSNALVQIKDGFAEINSFTARKNVTIPLPEGYRNSSLNNDGTLWLVETLNGFTSFDLKSGKQRAVIEKTKGILKWQWSQDGTRLLACSQNKYIAFDMNKGIIIGCLPQDTVLVSSLSHGDFLRLEEEGLVSEYNQQESKLYKFCRQFVDYKEKFFCPENLIVREILVDLERVIRGRRLAKYMNDNGPKWLEWKEENSEKWERIQLAKWRGEKIYFDNGKRKLPELELNQDQWDVWQNDGIFYPEIKEALQDCVVKG